MTDEMKPVSTQDLRAVALYLTTGGARAGSFEFDTEDGRRIRLSATEVGGPFDEALSAPSSPGDGWVMVPREPTDEMLLKGHHQIDWGRDDQPTNTNDDPLQKLGGVGTTCKEDLRDAYRAMLAAAPSPGGDHG